MRDRLGTMTFGEQVDEDPHRILTVAARVDFIDTAEIYPCRPARRPGATEIIIGNWLVANPGVRRKVLATKVAGPSRGMPWVREGKGMTPADIVVVRGKPDGKTDVIDLYQIHRPGAMCRLWQHLFRPLRKARSRRSMPIGALGAGEGRQGARIGLSNETPGVHEFVRLAEHHGLPRVASVQNASTWSTRA